MQIMTRILGKHKTHFWSGYDKLRVLIVVSLVFAMASSVVEADEWSKEKADLIDLGRQHETAWDLYLYFRDKEKENAKRQPDIPDWRGIWVRDANLRYFDPDDQVGSEASNSVGSIDYFKSVMPILKPAAKSAYLEMLDLSSKGISYDAMSSCGAPGYPRWLTEPRDREFVVKTYQTWFINELFNDIRRIYTDGRGHLGELDSNPVINGDSIGFWSMGRLYIHTNDLMAGAYQTVAPTYSDQVETVEIWQMLNEDTIVADVWVYDPETLVAPWFARQPFVRVPNDDKLIRIRPYDCAGSDNNRVIKTEEGASKHVEFDWEQTEDVE